VRGGGGRPIGSEWLKRGRAKRPGWRLKEVWKAQNGIVDRKGPQGNRSDRGHYEKEKRKDLASAPAETTAEKRKSDRNQPAVKRDRKTGMLKTKKPAPKKAAPHGARRQAEKGKRQALIPYIVEEERPRYQNPTTKKFPQSIPTTIRR